MDQLWAGVGWSALQDTSSSERVLAWCKTAVPYSQDANALQTLDVWIPAARIGAERPAREALPSAEGTWLVYVHGGAWRDPKITPASFTATVREYLAGSPEAEGVAGFASLSYSLSPYPDDGTDPMPPSGPDQPRDPSRSVEHPHHIRDVLLAIKFLKGIAGLGSNYVLVGHSCGATLALQVAMNHDRWIAGGPEDMPKPQAIVGLNGLYDLAALVHDPGEKHRQVVPIYGAFLRGAFGDDEAAWRAVSPACVADWANEWSEGRRVLLCQSREDSLVPYAQTGAMLGLLRQSSRRLRVDEGEVGGEHNDVWIQGKALARLLREMLEQLKA